MRALNPLWGPLVGSAESGSEHPLAKAVVSYALKRFPERRLVDPSAFDSLTGKGIVCEVQGTAVSNYLLLSN
eukprot:1181554-Prorocentrum_minimum.AAC.3